MTRYFLRALIIFVVGGITGCSLVPSFPDLWPFNDEPVFSYGAQESTVKTRIEPELAVEIVQTAAKDESSSPPDDSDDVTPSVPGTIAYFILPADGTVVSNPVRVLFGLIGMGVAPAASIHEGTGHHHLLIDTELPPTDEPIPADENHLHFGNGQTETSLDLPAGQHTLQLVLGDHNHTPHQPPVVSRRISITVQ